MSTRSSMDAGASVAHQDLNPRARASAASSAGSASSLRTSVLLLSTLVSGTGACYIQGKDSGVCRVPQEFERDMPYCASRVRYRACVPRELPWFPNITTVNKDKWVGKMTESFISERLAIENGDLKPDNPTLYNYWTGEAPEPRFSKSDDCSRAYRNFMCYLAFPRCDDAGESMNICRSVCENMMRSCKYEKEMWRCYEPAYFGGKKPEGTDMDQLLNKEGNPVYKRAEFPGTPFTENQFSDGDPLAVCTPSLADGAAEAFGKFAALGSLLLCAAAAVLAGLA